MGGVFVTSFIKRPDDGGTLLMNLVTKRRKQNEVVSASVRR
jgi:hypothetical protein